jgi:hypothetical protein
MYFNLYFKLFLYSFSWFSFLIVNSTKEDGGISFHLDEIAAGKHATFTVTVVPKLFGTYESTRARIKYSGGQATSTDFDVDSIDMGKRSGYSTSLGKIKILSDKEYLNSKAIDYSSWFFYIATLTILGLIGYYLFVQITKKNQKTGNSKKRS